MNSEYSEDQNNMCLCIPVGADTTLLVIFPLTGQHTLLYPMKTQQFDVWENVFVNPSSKIKHGSEDPFVFSTRI